MLKQLKHFRLLALTCWLLGQQLNAAIMIVPAQAGGTIMTGTITNPHPTGGSPGTLTSVITITESTPGPGYLNNYGTNGIRLRERWNSPLNPDTFTITITSSLPLVDLEIDFQNIGPAARVGNFSITSTSGSSTINNASFVISPTVQGNPAEDLLVVDTIGGNQYIHDPGTSRPQASGTLSFPDIGTISGGSVSGASTTQITFDVFDFNDANWTAGFYIRATIVPEPSRLLLFGLGAAALMLRRTRRS